MNSASVAWQRRGSAWASSRQYSMYSWVIRAVLDVAFGVGHVEGVAGGFEGVASVGERECQGAEIQKVAAPAELRFGSVSPPPGIWSIGSIS